MHVLVICDDLWHPAEIIELGLKPMERFGFEFTIVKSAKEILTPEFIAQYPVIMCCKGNTMNSFNSSKPWFDHVAEVGVPELEEYVRNGGGFLAVHAGNTAREGHPYADFLGNFFVGHPPRCEMTVKMTADHPVTQGINDFTVRDEHYEIKIIDPEVQVFCKTYSETGGEQIGGYSKKIGKGQLCVLTPGHIVAVWHHIQFQKMLFNAIHYCAKTTIDLI